MLLLYFILSFFVVAEKCRGQVIEMDDRFPEFQKDHAWLMEFYAPWCGHCKHLEPIYHQVSLQLRTTAVKVARMDATKHPSLATLHHVTGFPTIIFIRGQMAVKYAGERTAEAIVHFAMKALRPSVTPITSTQHFLQLQQQHSNEVFFVLVEGGEGEGELEGKSEILKNVKSQFVNCSQKFFTSNDFFILPSIHLLPQHIQLPSTPNIISVQQDHVTHIPHEMLDGEVERWVGVERWGWVASVGAMKLNELNHIGKSLVILVTEQQDETYEMLHRVAKDSHQQLQQLQFVHLTDVEAGNNIIMDDDLEAPFFLLLIPPSHHFHLPTTPILTHQDLSAFILDVMDGRSETKGGGGLIERFKRMIYGIKNVFNHMWNDSAWLSALLVMVPCVILSVVCYIVCCIDVSEEDTTFEEHYGDGDDEYDDEDCDYSDDDDDDDDDDGKGDGKGDGEKHGEREVDESNIDQGRPNLKREDKKTQ